MTNYIFKDAVQCCKPKLCTRIFSSYKPIILLHDFFVLLSFSVLSYYFLGSHPLNEYPAIQTMIILVFITVYISTFWSFNLYSFNENFIWGDHYLQIKRAQTWILVTIGLIVLSVFLGSLYSHLVLISLFASIAVLIWILSKPSRNILTYMAFAVASSLLILGIILSVFEEGYIALRPQIIYLPLIAIIASGLIITGRYLLVNFIFKGFLRKTFRWKMVIIGSNEESKRIWLTSSSMMRLST